MERMKLLQESQLEEEGITQEELETRFELEKTESLLVAPSGEGHRGAHGWAGGPQGLGEAEKMARSQPVPGKAGSGPAAGWLCPGPGCAANGGCGGVPRGGRAVPRLQRPLLRGGPRVRLQGLHTQGSAGPPHLPGTGGCWGPQPGGARGWVPRVLLVWLVVLWAGWVAEGEGLGPGWRCHRVMELFRLEEITQSRHQPSAGAARAPPTRGPQHHISMAWKPPPGTRPPLQPWAAWARLGQPFWGRNCSSWPTGTCPGAA